MKSDAALRSYRLFHHLLQHLSNCFNLTVVQLNRFLQFGELLDQVARSRQQLPYANKCAHDLNVNATAVGDLSTLESMATPCSVKTKAVFAGRRGRLLISQFAISKT
jgi:hypothetical protein